MAGRTFPIRSVLVWSHGWSRVSHQVRSCMEASWLVKSLPSGQILYGGVMAGQKFPVRSDLVRRLLRSLTSNQTVMVWRPSVLCRLFFGSHNKCQHLIDQQPISHLTGQLINQPTRQPFMLHIATVRATIVFRTNHCGKIRKTDTVACSCKQTRSNACFFSFFFFNFVLEIYSSV